MNQFKKSEDLEIYEMDFSNNAHLQEVCEIRQPVLFQFKQIHPKFFQDISPKNIAKYGSYDVKIKDAHDYYTKDQYMTTENSQVDSVALSLNSTAKLLENDNAAHFFTENNEDFLEESGLLRNVQSMDDFLKPVFNVHTKYDLMFGSRNAVTPLRYHTNYRQFLCVASGKIRIKMTPWKSSKYLHQIKDYENYEFRSPVHPNTPLAQYVNDFEKTKFLEFDVAEGYVLYVPPYWWYSIQYTDDPATFICSVSYNTIMNCISNLPDLGLYWLQQQNITKKITKIPPTFETIKAVDIVNISTSGPVKLETPIIETPVIETILPFTDTNTTVISQTNIEVQTTDTTVKTVEHVVVLTPSELLFNPSQNNIITTDTKITLSDPLQTLLDPSQNIVQDLSLNEIKNEIITTELIDNETKQ